MKVAFFCTPFENRRRYSAVDKTGREVFSALVNDSGMGAAHALDRLKRAGHSVSDAAWASQIITKALAGKRQAAAPSFADRRISA